MKNNKYITRTGKVITFSSSKEKDVNWDNIVFARSGGGLSVDSTTSFLKKEIKS